MTVARPVRVPFDAPSAHKSMTYATRLTAFTLVCAALWGVPQVLRAEPAPPAPAPMPMPGGVKAADGDGMEFFEKKVRPLLASQCYECHSADAEKVKGGLLLDTRAGILKGGSSGKPSVIPGDPDNSPLIRAVKYHDENLQMPPSDKMPEEQIVNLVTWVRMGMPDPRIEPPAGHGGEPPKYSPGDPRSPEARSHWSYQPIKVVTPPSVSATHERASEIDRFVYAKLEEQNLRPVGAADRRTLIRRATFDLTGLPPTPAEVETFVSDASPNAFEKLVDRLLDSPHYGERWGRHWLDLVHYADTAGDSSDYPVPEAFRYRNYVIESFNRDKPYDRFIREQLAGDLMPAKPNETEKQRQERVIATGLLAGMRRFSVNPDREKHLTIEDTIDTVGKSMLGLTVACARCHDHKFDAIPTSDYYALYGIFDSTRYPYAGSEEKQEQRDFVPLCDPALEKTLMDGHRARVKVLVDAIVKTEKAATEEKDPTLKRQLRADVEVIRRARVAMGSAMPTLPYAYAVAEDKPHDVKVHVRGERHQQGDVAPRQFLTVLGGQKLENGDKTSGRLELAGWLTDPSNPLTARVMVNRIWQYHFGRGLVSTPSDFGKRGQPPSHPELLDYLARRFVDGGWSMKALHKAVMLTDAYQRSSELDARDAQADPTNVYLWQFSRRRLSAEEARDAILATAGTLDRSIPGPHPFPAKWRWKYTQHAAFVAVYDTPHRSVYLMQQRIRRQPFLATFDGADTNASTAERVISTTPLQALFLMNDAWVHRQSEALAQQLLAEHKTQTDRVRAAYAALLARPATDEEVALGESYLRDYQAKLAATPTTRPAAAAEPEKLATAAYVRALFSSNEFFFVD
jgi:hypothetical protein